MNTCTRTATKLFDFVRDLMVASSPLDRSFVYDHKGRLLAAATGKEARNEPSYDGPYRINNMFYDVWDNLTGRTGRHILSNNDFSTSYTNDRNPVWQHEEAGNLKDTSPVSGGGQTYRYNAAGWVTDTAGASGSFSLEYDGDGQEVKRLEGGSSTYYVRSTVRGGRKISEVNAAGQKLRTFVYAQGQRLARQGENGGVKFEHVDPASTSVRKARINRVQQVSTSPP